VANYQRNEIVPGLFVLAAAAVFTLFAFRVGRWGVLDFLKGERLTCRAVFDEVKTLAVGAKVSVAGRRVGEVSRLRWTETPYSAEDLEYLRQQLGALPPGLRVGSLHLVVEVEFELADRELRLEPASAQVALLQEGLLGNYFVDLYPGHWEPPGEPPRIFAAGLIGPLTLRARRAGGIDALSATLGDAIDAFHSLAKVLTEGVFSAPNRDNLAALLDALRRSGEEIAVLLRSDNDAGLQASAMRPLRLALETATTTVEQLRARLLEGTLPKADALLEQTQRSVQSVETAVTAARQDVGAVLAQLDATLLDVRPELADSARRLRQSLWQAELALRKIRFDPSVLFWGSSGEDLEAAAGEPGSVGPSGRARIYRQRDEHATGK
jgi:ABC-type transporter Mla subunit MlaD